MIKLNRSYNQQSGGYIVLITVLVLGAMVIAIIGLILITGQNASVSSSSVAANVSAKAAATGCAELALGTIQSNSSLTTPYTANQTIDSTVGSRCSYTITGSPPNFAIAATGTVTQGQRSYTHRLTVTTNQVSPQVVVNSWQDTP